MVEIEQADGSVEKYSVEETLQSADELHADLTQRMLGRPAPQVALMRWYRESANFYVAASCETRPGEQTNGQPMASGPGMTMPSGEVFHTTSARQASMPVARGSDSIDSKSSSSHWQNFWSQRENQAAVWLARQETQVAQRLDSLQRSIHIIERHRWMPPKSTIGLAFFLSMMVLVTGCLWRLVCPPRSLQFDQAVVPGVLCKPTGANTAAMCFRQSWVRARQPALVLAQGMMGWGICGAATFTLLYVVVFRV